MKLAFNIDDALDLGTSKVGQSQYAGDFMVIFWNVIKNLYVLTGIILLLFIISGGLTMILNSGNAEKQKQGSQTLTMAVAGYLIMFAAYWLVRIAEIFFGVNIFL